MFLAWKVVSLARSIFDEITQKYFSEPKNNKLTHVLFIISKAFWRQSYFPIGTTSMFSKRKEKIEF